MSFSVVYFVSFQYFFHYFELKSHKSTPSPISLCSKADSEQEKKQTGICVTFGYV